MITILICVLLYAVFAPFVGVFCCRVSNVLLAATRFYKNKDWRRKDAKREWKVQYAIDWKTVVGFYTIAIPSVPVVAIIAFCRLWWHLLKKV